MKDKLIERERYDARALSHVIKNVSEIPDGSLSMPTYLRTPYIYYEQQIAELIRPHHHVLELGAGMGLHTRALLNTGAQIVATDISLNSLNFLNQRFLNTPGNLKTEVADMENLPFEDSSFDVITCAGSLSYGKPVLVDAEIRRVLRPGGIFICVDSLNHNPLYRINRWLHYLRGNRSKSTLMRMPDLTRIRALGDGFLNVNANFFGSLSFAMPLLSKYIGMDSAKLVSDEFDHLIGIKRSAFKFVLVAQGFIRLDSDL